MPSNRNVKRLRDSLGVGASVAHELLVLSGDDVLLAEEASRESTGLDQCKANIIDKRFRRLEDGCQAAR